LKTLPAALLQELHGIKSFDEKAFIDAHQKVPITSVRLNPAKDIMSFAGNAMVPWCPSGIYLPERPIFTLDPAYHAGAYYVQEASSMFLDHLLSNILQGRTGLRVLDLCAAPGGKSTLIASLLDKDSLLVSNEVIRTRAPILEENMTRWGHMNTWVTGNDARDFAKLPGYFDVIVVDAPCSGSGLFRKNERARDEWSEANVQLCCERQQRILADIWPSLKQNGILVYATCSYSAQEDEEILGWLGSSFEVSPLTVPVNEAWGVVTTNSPLKQMAGYRFFPDKVKGEGFFIAALQKKEETDTLRLPRFRSANDKKTQQQAGYLLKEGDYAFVQTGKEGYSAVRSCHEADIQLLQKALYLRKIGVALGGPAGSDWIPAHEVALSMDADHEIASVSVNKEQALRFLKREDMGLADIPKGWLRVTYDGLGLGWVKSLGNRVNNYLPKSWRIRMDIPDYDR
jgi:16S rRNA C967 or C1407 C5-methylase (RsmB/RsmF family)/NOL1/NOP2/fmu family ribosome biogenesis protein